MLRFQLMVPEAAVVELNVPEKDDPENEFPLIGIDISPVVVAPVGHDDPRLGKSML